VLREAAPKAARRDPQPRAAITTIKQLPEPREAFSYVSTAWFMIRRPAHRASKVK
jgi:hypothetical protein